MPYPVLIIPEGIESSDGRSYPPGILTWRERYEFMFLDKTTEGHMGAVHVGNLDNLRRQTVDGLTWIVGDLTYDSDVEAQEAERLAREDKIRRVSADIAVNLQQTGVDDDGFPIVEIVTAELVGTTQTPMSAFGDARILVGDEAAAMLAVAASGAALPPRDSFFIPEPPDDDPRYVTQDNGELAIPITFDGRRFYGHAHYRGACHTGYANTCVDPTTWETEYQSFHVNLTPTDEGDVPTGPCLWRGDHAPLTLDTDQARDHYSHHAYQWGDARAIAGRHGIWLSGHVRPTVTDDELAILRQFGVSGDWRRGKMIAALTVNRSALGVSRHAVAASGAMSDGMLRARVVGEDVFALVASPVDPGPDRDRDDLIVEALRLLGHKLDKVLLTAARPVDESEFRLVEIDGNYFGAAPLHLQDIDFKDLTDTVTVTESEPVETPQKFKGLAAMLAQTDDDE